jgi:subtilisin-like proprotein convertase family protein
VELEDSPGVDIPDDDPEGIERILVADTSGQVKDISVSVDITHTYIGDLVIKLVSPSGKTVDLHRPNRWNCKKYHSNLYYQYVPRS